MSKEADKATDFTLEEVREFLELPSVKKHLPAFVRRGLALPPDPERKVYSVLRDLYLKYFDEWWDGINEYANGATEDTIRPDEALSIFKEIDAWLTTPYFGSLESALVLAGEAKSTRLKRWILDDTGKRNRGQPATKKRLAVIALDAKCIHPEMTLREVTHRLCPCGRTEHLPQCREQLRQQINRLVKFLRTHGYDFTWDKIKE